LHGPRPCSADLAPTYVLSSPVPDQLRSLCTPPTPTCDTLVLTNRICLIAQCILCFSHSLNLTELPQPDRPDHPTNVCVPLCTSPRCTASRPATTPLFILRVSPSCSCSRVLLAPSPPPPPPRLKRRRPLHLGLLHTPQPRLPSQPGFPASCSSLALILRPPFPPPASFVFLDCCTLRP